MDGELYLGFLIIIVVQRRIYLLAISSMAGAACLHAHNLVSLGSWKGYAPLWPVLGRHQTRA